MNSLLKALQYILTPKQATNFLNYQCNHAVKTTKIFLTKLQMWSNNNNKPQQLTGTEHAQVVYGFLFSFGFILLNYF